MIVEPYVQADWIGSRWLARKLGQPSHRIAEETSWVVRTVGEEEKDFLFLSEVDGALAIHVPVSDRSALVKHHSVLHCH